MLRTPRTSNFPRSPTAYEPLNSQHEDYRPDSGGGHGKSRRTSTWYRPTPAMIVIWMAAMFIILSFAADFVKPVQIYIMNTKEIFQSGGFKSGDEGIVGTTTGSAAKVTTSPEIKETEKTPVKAPEPEPEWEPLEDIVPPKAVILEHATYKWTVYMSQQSRLSSKALPETCKSVDNITMQIHKMQTGREGHVHRPYYYVDPGFVDVQVPGEDPEVCKTSLTYLMESEGVASIGHTLMGLFMAYGLAKAENRSFFIENGDWAYGKISDYYMLPDKPDCKPPPPQAQLPCPHQSRHLVISTSTFKWHFGHMFNEHLEDGHKQGVFRKQAMYEMLKDGYDAFYMLSPEMQDLLQVRTSKVQKRDKDNSPAVAVQIRRGDRHPREYKYVDDYIPIERFLNVARNMTIKEENAPELRTDTELVGYPKSYEPMILLASDDGGIFEEYTIDELIKSGKLESAQESRLGDDGGFYTNKFWDMDDASRKRLGQSYVLDLKGLEERIMPLETSVEGSGPGWAVCTVDATMCRLLAVALGWEHAMEGKRWMNIDGVYDWYGIKW